VPEPELYAPLVELLRHVLNNELPRWAEAAAARGKTQPIARQDALEWLVIYVRAADRPREGVPAHDASAAALALAINDGAAVETVRAQFGMGTKAQVYQILRSPRFASCRPPDFNADVPIADRAAHIRFRMEHAANVWREDKRRAAENKRTIK
jgi:hypothetical protein